MRSITCVVAASLIISLAWSAAQLCGSNGSKGKCAASLEEDGGLLMLQHVVRASELKPTIQGTADPDRDDHVQRPLEPADAQMLKLRSALLQIMHCCDHDISLDGPDNNTQEVNVVWDQIQAAARIDRLREELEMAVKSDRKAVHEEIMATLRRMTEKYPFAEAVKEQFAEDWAKLKDAVDLKDFAHQLANSSGLSKNDFQGLRDAYDSLAQLAMSDLVMIRENRHRRRRELQQDGSVPKVEDIKTIIGNYVLRAKDAVGSARSSTSEAMGSMQDVWKKWWH